MRWRTVISCFVLGLSTLLLYWRAGGYPFIEYDDGLYIFRNATVLQGLTWEGIQWAFTELHGRGTYWHPLTWVSHMLDVEWFGLAAGGHHQVNVLIHSANGMLVFLLFLRITRQAAASFFLALLFLWHPLQADSVVWIAERKNLLTTFFGLLTMGFYARYVQEKSRRWFWLAWGWFAMALLCKPALVTLPFVLLLLDYWPLQRLESWHWRQWNQGEWWGTFRSLFFEKWPFYLLTITSCVITLSAHTQLGMLKAEGYPFAWRLGNAIVSYGRYLKKFFFPNDLGILYPHLGFWPGWLVVIVFLGLAIVTAAVLFLAHRKRYLLVGWFWFLGVLVPTIGLTQVGEQSMADRFFYVPLLGVGLMLAWSVFSTPKEKKFPAWWRLLLAGFLAAGFLGFSWRQIGYWEHSETLFKRTLAITKKNHTIHNNLAYVLIGQGKDDEARVHLERALWIYPDFSQAHYQLGLIHQRKKNPELARIHLERAAALSGKWPAPHLALARVLKEDGDLEKAQAAVERYVQLNPSNPDGWAELGDVLLARQQPEQAILHWQKSLAIAERLGDLIAARQLRAKIARL